MVYHSRIPAADDYLHSLGRAFYNFTYLEWWAIWTLVKLSPNGFGDVPSGKGAAKIAEALGSAIQNTTPPLSTQLRSDLLAAHSRFRAAIRKRNKLLHAHPYTASGGAQQLGGGGIEWSIDEVDAVARFFEELAIDGNNIFHSTLKAERP